MTCAILHVHIHNTCTCTWKSAKVKLTTYLLQKSNAIEWHRWNWQKGHRMSTKLSITCNLSYLHAHDSVIVYLRLFTWNCYSVCIVNTLYSGVLLLSCYQLFSFHAGDAWIQHWLYSKRDAKVSQRVWGRGYGVQENRCLWHWLTEACPSLPRGFRFHWFVQGWWLLFLLQSG